MKKLVHGDDSPILKVQQDKILALQAHTLNNLEAKGWSTKKGRASRSRASDSSGDPRSASDVDATTTTLTTVVLGSFDVGVEDSTGVLTTQDIHSSISSGVTSRDRASQNVSTYAEANLAFAEPDPALGALHPAAGFASVSTPAFASRAAYRSAPSKSSSATKRKRKSDADESNESHTNQPQMRVRMSISPSLSAVSLKCPPRNSDSSDRDSSTIYTDCALDPRLKEGINDAQQGSANNANSAASDLRKRKRDCDADDSSPHRTQQASNDLLLPKKRRLSSEAELSAIDPNISASFDARKRKHGPDAEDNTASQIDHVTNEQSPWKRMRIPFDVSNSKANETRYIMRGS